MAGVDDAASVAGFGIMASIMFSKGGKIIQGYVSQCNQDEILKNNLPTQDWHFKYRRHRSASLGDSVLVFCMVRK